MKEELEKRCNEYLADWEQVKAAFRWDHNDLYSVCANVFCACGKEADAERLKACIQVIKKHSRMRSRFRSRKVRAILASMLSIGDDPEARMAMANDYYLMLKRKFKSTDYLVLTAFLLADLAEKPLTEEAAERGKEIYRRMNQKHRMLTDKTDSVFAMLLASTEKSPEELTDEVEKYYQLLKDKFSQGGPVQTAAQVLCMARGTPEEKTQRMIELYDALQEAGVKYGHGEEIAPLAALSLADTPIPVLTEEIGVADEFLKTMKACGIKEKENEKRAVHAVMIVSDQYAGTDQVNVTVMTNTLDMLFAKQTASRISLGMHVGQFLLEYLFGGKDEKEKSEPADTDPHDIEKQEENK